MPSFGSVKRTQRPLSPGSVRQRRRRSSRVLHVPSSLVADFAPAALFLEQFLLGATLRGFHVLYDLAGDHLGDGRASPLGVILLLELLPFEQKLPLIR